MDKQRVLVFSNNCFSNENTNGRTLGNLFACLDKNNIAQFFISGEPDYEICANYFQVTDGQAKQSFINGKKQSGEIIKNNGTVGNGIKGVEKNPLTMILRNIIWNSNRWKGKTFFEWVEAFNPNIVLIQAGDDAFMYKLALKTAKKYKLPLVVYNTEGYYFNKHNYLNPTTNNFGWLYPLFIADLKKTMKQTDKYTKCYIYLCDMLKNYYDKVLKKPSYVIYNSSNLMLKERVNNEKIVISYLGNMGHWRIKPLIEIGEALQDIDNSVKLNVYGKPFNQEDLEELTKCKGINYKGLVPYDEVINVMGNSDILVNVDSFEQKYYEELRFAFSGKIADSLASGRVFFVYEPEYTAISQYLNANNIAVVANNKNEMINKLKLIINDEDYRKNIVKKQLEVADANHNLLTNSKKFLDILFVD